MTASDAWNDTRIIEFDPPFFATSITLARKSKPFEETMNGVYYGTQQVCTASGRWDFKITAIDDDYPMPIYLGKGITSNS